MANKLKNVSNKLGKAAGLGLTAAAALPAIGAATVVSNIVKDSPLLKAGKYSKNTYDILLDVYDPAGAIERQKKSHQSHTQHQSLIRSFLDPDYRLKGIRERIRQMEEEEAEAERKRKRDEAEAIREKAKADRKAAMDKLRKEREEKREAEQEQRKSKKAINDAFNRLKKAAEQAKAEQAKVLDTAKKDYEKNQAAIAAALNASKRTASKVESRAQADLKKATKEVTHRTSNREAVWPGRESATETPMPVGMPMPKKSSRKIKEVAEVLESVATELNTSTRTNAAKEHAESFFKKIEEEPIPDIKEVFKNFGKPKEAPINTVKDAAEKLFTHAAEIAKNLEPIETKTAFDPNDIFKKNILPEIDLNPEVTAAKAEANKLFTKIVSEVEPTLESVFSKPTSEKKSRVKKEEIKKELKEEIIPIVAEVFKNVIKEEPLIPVEQAREMAEDLFRKKESKRRERLPDIDYDPRLTAMKAAAEELFRPQKLEFDDVNSKIENLLASTQNIKDAAESLFGKKNSIGLVEPVEEKSPEVLDAIKAAESMFNIVPYTSDLVEQMATGNSNSPFSANPKYARRFTVDRLTRETLMKLPSVLNNGDAIRLGIPDEDVDLQSIHKGMKTAPNLAAIHAKFWGEKVVTEPDAETKKNDKEQTYTLGKILKTLEIQKDFICELVEGNKFQNIENTMESVDPTADTAGINMGSDSIGIKANPSNGRGAMAGILAPAEAEGGLLEEGMKVATGLAGFEALRKISRPIGRLALRLANKVPLLARGMSYFGAGASAAATASAALPATGGLLSRVGGFAKGLAMRSIAPAAFIGDAYLNATEENARRLGYDPSKHADAGVSTALGNLVGFIPDAASLILTGGRYDPGITEAVSNADAWISRKSDQYLDPLFRTNDGKSINQMLRENYIEPRSNYLRDQIAEQQAALAELDSQKGIMPDAFLDLQRQRIEDDIGTMQEEYRRLNPPVNRHNTHPMGLVLNNKNPGLDLVSPGQVVAPAKKINVLEAFEKSRQNSGKQTDSKSPIVIRQGDVTHNNPTTVIQQSMPAPLRYEDVKPPQGFEYFNGGGRIGFLPG